MEGELVIRDAVEPYALTSPTSLTGTNDTATGAITGGSFSTPQVSLQQEITSPLPATVFIDADFSLVTPGSATGTVDFEGNLTVQTSLRVDLHIDVQPPGGGTTIIASDCVASPVPLTLQGVYDPETERVDLADEDFSVPEVVADADCSSLVSGSVNEQLAGAGHALSMTLAGTLTLPLPPGCETATVLSPSPAEESVLGDPVELTAMVSVPDPAQAECVEAAADGETTEGGLVDFFDGDTVVGTAVVDAGGVATLSTGVLPAGTRSLSARFRAFTPFRGSVTAEAVAYRVTANPAITSTLPEHVQIGAAAPTEFDVTVTNTGFGRDIENGRLDITLNRSEGTLDLRSTRVTLERQDGMGTWVPVTLTPQSTGTTTNRVMWGSVGDAAGLPLDIGESVTARLRIRFPLTGGTVSTTSCGATQETCPGPLDVTVELIEVDETGAPAATMAPAPGAIATATGRTSLVEATRRPSTITVGVGSTPGIAPQTVRQGGTVGINQIQLGPNLGGIRPRGHLTFLLDGAPLGVRWVVDGGAPPEAPPLDRVPATGANIFVVFDLPPDVPLGVHTVTVRYGGSDWFLPQHLPLTFTVVGSVGTLFDCLSPGLIPTWYRAFVEGQAHVPAIRPVGSQVDLGHFTLTMKFARENQGQNNSRMIIVPDNTTREVGINDLSIDLGFGPGGSGTGVSLTHTFGRTMTGAGDPDPAQVDELIVVNAPTGTVTLDGMAGDLVPVTLDRVHVQVTSDTGFPTPMTCTPVDQPLLLGEVTLSGHTLTAEPGGPVREGDDVTLTSAVAPFRTGQVEFLDGAETIGVSPVIDGVASTSTGSLPAGVRSLTAVFTGGLLIPPLVSNLVNLDVVAIQCPPLEEGSGAVVRLVYLELLGRCPDEAGYAFWKGRLDGGVSPHAFAATISASDEAVDRVVNDAYQAMLSRDAEPAGKAFWTDRLQAGGRYDDLLADLAASPEFSALAGGTDEGIVERVYERLLGRPADPAGLTYWTGRLDAGVPRRVMVLTFATLDEPLGRLVDAAYGDLLGRAPTAGERADGIAHLRSTGDRSGLHARLIGLTEFDDRAQEFPNP